MFCADVLCCVHTVFEYSQVYLATWHQTKVAVKYLTKYDGESEKEFVNEIKLMSECFNKNIVTFYSACMEPQRVRRDMT